MTDLLEQIKFNNDKRSPWLAHLALVIASACTVVLCAVNQHTLQGVQIQSIATAVFCIQAAILYAVYMCISKVLSLVLTYAESFHGYSGYFDEEVPRYKRHIYGTPRNIVISSMYLGGTGAFLAISPLCMWDITVSAAFTLSLITLSIIDASKVASDFKPNVDQAGVITTLKRIRYCKHLLLLITNGSIMWLDEKMKERHWPLLLLAAVSPVLLRAGGGGVGHFLHSMPPSQALETGLPVSTLSAILVLCWYSPIELENFTIQKQNAATSIPMLILVPPSLAAALAFILHSFKKRTAGTTAALLTCTLMIRQQVEHRFHTRIDWLSLFLCATSLGLTLLYHVYKSQNIQTYTKMPEEELKIMCYDLDNDEREGSEDDVIQLNGESVP